MKTFTLVLAMLFSLTAQATSIQHSYRAKLDSFYFDAESPLSKLDVRAAAVEVNFLQDYLQLEIMLPWSCPPNALCALVMPMRHFKVENFVESVDACGATIYEAEYDDRPTDGIYERITVIDNTTNICFTFSALSATRVEHEVKYYNRIDGKEVKYFDSFEGQKLK